MTKPANSNVVELALREKPGRRQLVNELFDHHARALRTFLLGRSARRDEIEDLVQELFMRLMAVQRLEEKMAAGTGSNRSFLLTMANNLMVDKQRKERVRNAHAQAQRDVGSEQIEDRSPERILAVQLELEAIRAVILDLPPHWRAVLVLQRFHNMTYEDIALHLGVTKTQAENYMRRALRKLRNARRKIEAEGERS
ncbi:MAG: RNA polymerase sigma factor [Gammaproteobacteria bacterium]|nr:RNA polymerase sigma factor [Gammaproteobacteria bacterium]